MSTEIAVRAATLPEKMRYAESLACSFMLPEQYRKQPANVLWAIEYGETIGITAMAAITGVHMIEGKPTASAALISGLVRRAGHKLRSGYDAATRTGWAEIVRCDDPDFTFRSEWNVDRAVEAELVQIGPKGELIAKDSKGRSKPWKKFYPSMTKARATTEVARDACEEVLFGLHYTPEELGADTDDEGNLVVQAARAAWTAEQGDQWQTPAPAASTANAAEEVEYAEEVESRPPNATPDQVNNILAALKALRVKDREQARVIISEKAGREIGGPADLTAAEADRVLEQLTVPPAEPDLAVPDAPAPPGSPNNPPITTPEMRMIQGLFSSAGMADRDKQHAFIARVLGAPVASRNDLTHDQFVLLRQALTTGEIPAAPPATAGPAPSDEGIAEFDALHQIISDAQTPDEFEQARADIEREHAEGGIGGDQLAALQAHWIDRRNEKQAMAGAAS